jgi:hypothetical protein
MVEPAGVHPMANRIAGISEADYLVDRLTIVSLSNVGEPCSKIGGGLPPEPVLWCLKKRSVVTSLTQRRHQGLSDHQVPPL